MMVKTLFVHSLCLSLVLLSSCTSNRRTLAIEPPDKALDHASEKILQTHLVEQNDQSIPHFWWTLFSDPQLDYLIETALSRNPTLQIAQKNIQLAAAEAKQFKSALYPQIFYGADVSHQKLSQTGLIPFSKDTSGITSALTGEPTGATTSIPNLLPGAGLTTPAPAGLGSIPVYFTQYENEMTLNYAFDIWGKRRKRWIAALSEYRAKLADQAFIQLQLSVTIAQLYYQIQINRQRREIYQQLVDNKQNVLELNQKKVRGRLSSLQNVYYVQSDLAFIRQNLLQVENSLAIDEFQLQALVANQFEEKINSFAIETKPLPPIPFPNDLPLHLISKRPDITAQLWLIESGEKQIEVAQAGFYPDFNLFALFGFQTIHLSELFHHKSTYFNIDPAVTLPIFDGGRLRANLQESEINYDLAILNYNQLILDATKEVLTQISVLMNSKKQLNEFNIQVKEQRKILDLIELRIAHHLDSKLSYLSQQEVWLLTKNEELIAFNKTVDATLLLIKALGGGYDPCTIEEEVCLK